MNGAAQPATHRNAVRHRLDLLRLSQAAQKTLLSDLIGWPQGAF
jgi:hypothetical protein